MPHAHRSGHMRLCLADILVPYTINNLETCSKSNLALVYIQLEGTMCLISYWRLAETDSSSGTFDCDRTCVPLLTFSTGLARISFISALTRSQALSPSRRKREPWELSRGMVAESFDRMGIAMEVLRQGDLSIVIMALWPTASRYITS